ncbi:MAG TPA: DUF2231 domain-containing protein [Candidatus Dormibacteraeota bacterium]|nr:DUF2231 domain-containing protein [Candidatus Dormibacteraeota bacterium]
MFGYDWPRFHAAVNDLPAALLFVTVLFELGGWLTKRESLKVTALWTLWAGVIGGWVAVVAGLQAEHVIEHGDAVHELMETHETLALTTMGIFTVVLVWRLVRRTAITTREEALLRVLGVAGLVTVVWTGAVGGRLVFEHSAGISTAVMKAELEDRAAGHHHDAGEADDEHHHQHPDSGTARGQTRGPGAPPRRP